MGFLNIFKKKNSQSTTNTQTTRTPAQVVQQALAVHDIKVEETEVSDLISHLWNSIKYVNVLPEVLSASESAELEFIGSGYRCKVSIRLMDAAGNISNNVLSTIMSCAVYWASASEIAKAKSIDKFVLKEGESIAICDYNGFCKHNIYSIFPDLLNKTAIL